MTDFTITPATHVCGWIPVERFPLLTVKGKLNGGVKICTFDDDLGKYYVFGSGDPASDADARSVGFDVVGDRRKARKTATLKEAAAALEKSLDAVVAGNVLAQRGGYKVTSVGHALATVAYHGKAVHSVPLPTGSAMALFNQIAPQEGPTNGEDDA